MPCFSPAPYCPIPPVEVASECDLLNSLRCRRSFIARTTKIPRTTAPPTEAPTIAPVESKGPLLSTAPEALVSAGGGATVEAKVTSVVGIGSVEEYTVGIGCCVGALSVTITVFLVTVTFELFGMVRVVPESVRVLDTNFDVVTNSLSGSEGCVSNAMVAVALDLDTNNDDSVPGPPLSVKKSSEIVGKSSRSVKVNV